MANKRWDCYVVSTMDKRTGEREGTYYTDAFSTQEAVNNIRDFIDPEDEEVIAVYKCVRNWK